MFKDVVLLLLGGEFICDISYPEAFGYLRDADNEARVREYLAPLNLRLSRTSEDDGTWYAAYERLGNAERRAVRDEFAAMKTKLRFIVEFFVTAMRADGRDAFFARGDTLEPFKLLNAINENPALRSDFQSLTSLVRAPAVDTRFKSILDAHLRALRNEGYLILVNEESEIYRVTGKIEYLVEVVEFLRAYDKIGDNEGEEETAPISPQLV